MSIISDTELVVAMHEQEKLLTPRMALFCRRYFVGATVREAALAAGMRDAERTPFRWLKKPGVVKYLELLREMARRKTMFTAEEAVRELRAIASDARAAGDFSAAVKGVRTASEICRHFPEANVALFHNTGPAQVVVQLQMPERLNPPSWLGTSAGQVVEVLPEPTSPPAGSGGEDEDPETTETEANRSRLDAAMAAFKSRRDTPRAAR